MYEIIFLLQGQRYVRFPYEGESQCGVKLLYCQRENNCVEKQSHSFTTNPDLMDSGVETVSGGGRLTLICRLITSIHPVLLTVPRQDESVTSDQGSLVQLSV